MKNKNNYNYKTPQKSGAIQNALLSVFLLAGLFMWGTCAPAERSIEEIRQFGLLRAGIKDDVPGFGMKNPATGAYEGLEIEIAKLLAKDILGGSDKIRYQPVTAKTRGLFVDNGELDVIIATFTINEERKFSYHFSPPYYTGAVGLLVKKEAGLGGLADFDGKIIGVLQSATSKNAVEEAAGALGLHITFAEFASNSEVKVALDSGRVDAFAIDKSILKGYVDAATVILPDEFTPQSYGVVTKRGNTELNARVDACIRRWLEDGTIAALVERFGL